MFNSMQFKLFIFTNHTLIKQLLIVKATNFSISGTKLRVEIVKFLSLFLVQKFHAVSYMWLKLTIQGNKLILFFQAQKGNLYTNKFCLKQFSLKIIYFWLTCLKRMLTAYFDFLVPNLPKTLIYQNYFYFYKKGLPEFLVQKMMNINR